MTQPYRIAEVVPTMPKDKIMTSARYGTGRARIRWDHGSGFVEVGTTDNATEEPDNWVRWPAEEWRDFAEALLQAIDEADTRNAS